MSTEQDERTLYVTNIDGQCTPDILEELFVQLSPVDSVFLSEGSNRYALVVLDDEESVPFCCEMLDGILLYGLSLSIAPKTGTQQFLAYTAKKTAETEGEALQEARRQSMEGSFDRSVDGYEYMGRQEVQQTPPQHGRHSFGAQDLDFRNSPQSLFSASFTYQSSHPLGGGGLPHSSSAEHLNRTGHSRYSPYPPRDYSFHSQTGRNTPFRGSPRTDSFQQSSHGRPSRSSSSSNRSRNSDGRRHERDGYRGTPTGRRW